MVFGALKVNLDIHNNRLGAKRLQQVVDSINVSISYLKAAQFKGRMKKTGPEGLSDPLSVPKPSTREISSLPA